MVTYTDINRFLKPEPGEEIDRDLWGAYLNQNADILEYKAITKGPLGDLPAPDNTGSEQRWYLATDTEPYPTLLYDNGTSWDTIFDGTIQGTEYVVADTVGETKYNDSRGNHRVLHPGDSISLCDDASEWVVLGEAVISEDTSTSYIGDRSIKLTSDSPGNDPEVYIDLSSNPIDLTDKRISFAWKTDIPENVGVTIRVLAPDYGNREVYFNTGLSQGSPMDWQLFTGGYDPTQGAGSPDLSSVEYIHFKFNNTSSSDINVWVDDVRMVNKPDKAYLILNWDDCRVEHYNEAFTDMQKYGFPGVDACITGRVGTNSNHLTLAEMKEMQAAGWEFVSHTETHNNLTSMTAQEVADECRNSKEFLLKNGFGSGAESIVFPGNNFNSDVLDTVSEYYRMAGFNSKSDATQSMTATGFDPLVMYRQIGSGLSEMEELVDNIIADKQVGIINFHLFGESGTITRTEFQTFLEYIYPLTQAGDLEIITLSDLYEIRMGLR